MPSSPIPAISRRHFLQTVTAAAAAATLASRTHAAPPKIKLGLDNFSIRALGWKAPQLLDYAASLKLDTLLISDLDAYDSLDDGHLREVKAHADGLKIEMHVGSLSVCPTSVRFKNTWGTAEEHLATGIRVAKALGSPVFRCFLGAADDRKTEGGIRARIADLVKVLKATEKLAKDAGVKIAIENHSGDLHSWELVDLVEAAGPEFVGVTLDTGNATWTLEDPHDLIERLGPYAVSSGIRDNMVWETPEGATIAWTACGEGLMDWPKFATRWAALCPATPVNIETISGFSRLFPYKKEDFWQHYDKRPESFAKFEAMAKRGRAIPNFKVPEGVDKKVADQAYQKSEVERSVKFLREQVGLGLK